MFSLSSHKALTITLIVFSSLLIFLTLNYSPSLRQYTGISRPPARSSHGCLPEAYAAGGWSRKPEPPILSTKDDALLVSGFQGCASSREVSWHLGSGWDDKDDLQKRQWRGNASAYLWAPGTDCRGYTRPRPEDIVRQLVEDGGWLLLGDSITEGHFFSLSCVLYPHVRATPDYTLDWSFDRAWPQNLFLDPSSHLLPWLKFPDGFEIDRTPLVTFRRVDLLLGKAELDKLYSQLRPENHPETLFSDEGTWDLDPSAYLPEFFARLPAANYRTLVVSTAGHWTTTLFSAFHTESRSSGNGLRELLNFFQDAMKVWITKMAASLEQAKETKWTASGKERQVVVRAYLHGHESCHDESVELAGPWETYRGLSGIWYNWNWIRRFNDVFKVWRIVTDLSHPNIHFLSVDMPGLLRPDGHVQGDCLHTLTGSGIMEGWSEYISYFVSKLP